MLLREGFYEEMLMSPFFLPSSTQFLTEQYKSKTARMKWPERSQITGQWREVFDLFSFFLFSPFVSFFFLVLFFHFQKMSTGQQNTYIICIINVYMINSERNKKVGMVFHNENRTEESLQKGRITRNKHKRYRRSPRESDLEE